MSWILLEADLLSAATSLETTMTSATTTTVANQKLVEYLGDTDEVPGYTFDPRTLFTRFKAKMNFDMNVRDLETYRTLALQDLSD